MSQTSCGWRGFPIMPNKHQLREGETRSLYFFFREFFFVNERERERKRKGGHTLLYILDNYVAGISRTGTVQGLLTYCSKLQVAQDFPIFFFFALSSLVAVLSDIFSVLLLVLPFFPVGVPRLDLSGAEGHEDAVKDQVDPGGDEEDRPPGSKSLLCGLLNVCYYYIFYAKQKKSF